MYSGSWVTGDYPSPAHFTMLMLMTSLMTACGISSPGDPHIFYSTGGGEVIDPGTEGDYEKVAQRVYATALRSLFAQFVHRHRHKSLTTPLTFRKPLGHGHPRHNGPGPEVAPSLSGVTQAASPRGWRDRNPEQDVGGGGVPVLPRALPFFPVLFYAHFATFPHVSSLSRALCMLGFLTLRAAHPSCSSQLKPDAFPTQAVIYAKFRAVRKPVRPFPTTKLSGALEAHSSIPDLSALARGLRNSTPTRPQSPRTNMRDLAPCRGLP
ncbi:hypothetical protein EDB89DRAFT_2251072 [Lactarius sanguifluus]|nr:hypothetical protein EDB89DRAFT_2251072 [Lactarius sanguifluus]